MSSPHLRDATAADLDALAAVAAEALSTLPLWTELIPDRGERRAVMAALYRGMFADALARGGRVRLAEDEHGVTAAALWSSPGNWRPSTLRGLQALPGMVRALGLRGTVRLMTVSGRGSAVAVKSHPSEPHWYLAVVATADRSRGRGLGTLLLEDGLAHVDAQGMPAYLECEPHLEGWYRRFGFGVRQVLEIPEGIVDGAVLDHQLGMWRIPSHA